MTLQEALQIASNHPLLLIMGLGSPVVLSLLAGQIHGRKSGDPGKWKYLYTFVVYWVCIPGIFASLLTVYKLFFRRADLMNLDLLTFVFPIISMGLCLAIIRWNVDLERIPGFGRLSGLMLMLAISFLVALVIDRTRIWLFFGSSFLTFVALFLIAFALIRIGAEKVFRRPAKDAVDGILSQMGDKESGS